MAGKTFLPFHIIFTLFLCLSKRKSRVVDHEIAIHDTPLINTDFANTNHYEIDINFSCSL